MSDILSETIATLQDIRREVDDLPVAVRDEFRQEIDDLVRKLEAVRQRRDSWDDVMAAGVEPGERIM